MTPEQQKALALARARRRRMQAGTSSEVIAEGVRISSEAQGGQQAALRRASEADQIAEDQMTLAGVPVPLRAVTSFSQGIPFVGEYTDELTGLMGGPEAAQAQRATQGAMERLYPKTSLGLQVAGGIAATAPLAAIGGGGRVADFVARGGSRVTQAGRAALVGGVAGAAEGASSFSGRADEAGEGSRGSAALTGLGVGGGLGATLGVFAPMIGEGVASLARRIKKLDVRVIADQFGISPPAARVVKGYLMNDDLDAAARVLARGGDDAMLAEAGPSTRQALDTAMSTGGEALSVARSRVEPKVGQAGQRLISTLDDVLGTADGGIKGAAKTIAKGTAAARKAAYDAAYAQPTPMASGQLDDILARIDPRDFTAAVTEASKEARDAGIRNLNIMASVDDAGNVVFSQPPSVMDLDYLARGLSNMVEAGTDKITGQMSPAARRASGQVKAIRDFLKENVPDYAKALKLGGDKIKQTEALTMGRRLLSETTTVEDVRNVMRGASEDVRAAARKGVRENLDAIMGRARSTIADLEAGNMDFAAGQNAAAEAVAAVRNLLNRNNMQKSRYVLGSSANRLFDELEKVGDALVLRAAVARGSATAIRTAGQQQMADEVAPGLLRRTLGNAGNPLEAGREITQTLAGIDARSISDAQRGYYAEIADALTRIRGQDAQRALAAVRKAMAGQPMKDAEARLIGRVVAGSATVGAYQAAKPNLAPQ